MTEIETDVLGGLVILTVLASTRKVKASLGHAASGEHQDTLELGVALDAIDMLAIDIIRCITSNVPSLDDKPSLVLDED